MPENDAHAPKPEDTELEQPVEETSDPPEVEDPTTVPDVEEPIISVTSDESEDAKVVNDKAGDGNTSAKQEASESDNEGDSTDAPKKASKKSAEKTPKKASKKTEPLKSGSKRGGLWRLGRKRLEEASGFMISTILHAIVLVVLALWMLPQVIEEHFTPLVVETLDPLEEELETVELDESLEVGTEMTFTSAIAGPIDQSMDVSEPEFEKAAVEESLEPVKVSLDASLGEMARSSGILQAAPDGVMGQARSVVQGYGKAMDRLTREILWMLEDNDVLVVWLFDESESMKDDQKEIAGRIAKVYEELGISGQAEGGALLTAICSYGETLHIQTEKATNNLEKIKEAIGSVPVDASGKESMCKSVSAVINKYRRFASSGKRKLALVMVTDESGDREGNVANLEQAIADARSARCTVYVLGREAGFRLPLRFHSLAPSPKPAAHTGCVSTAARRRPLLNNCKPTDSSAVTTPTPADTAPTNNLAWRARPAASSSCCRASRRNWFVARNASTNSKP